MSASIGYILLVSLFLMNELRAQSGIGCFSSVCPHTGQVRTDALLAPNGDYIGGCVCGCADNACPPPQIPTFNPFTLEGDCSCRWPLTQPPFPILPNGPRPEGIEVLCDVPGPCSCPPASKQPCFLTCDGIDGCKDGVIDCNNHGHPCTVNCNGNIACSSTVIINGPVGSALTVNCIGDKSCQGSVIINGNHGTDLTVACQGRETCTGTAIFNFGDGVGSISCNGDPQSCQGAIFILPNNIQSRPGAAFSCSGDFCPATAPPSFSNRAEEHVVNCAEPGDCSCPFGLQKICKINCIGEASACKDGLIECNNDGFDCFVNCAGATSCSGDASIMGPANAALTVQCIGEKSCEGSTKMNGEVSTDLTVVCHGVESCIGYAQFNFGSKTGTVWCTDPDSCHGVTFNLPNNAETTHGVSFSCLGGFCPNNAPRAFTNSFPPTTTTTAMPTSIPTTPTSIPTTPAPTTGALIPIMPIPTIPAPTTPPPTIPAPPTPPPTTPPPTTPPPTIPPPTIIIPTIMPTTTRMPTVRPPPLIGGRPIGPRVTSWCCHTSIEDFIPWFGRCWDKFDQISCDNAESNRCKWDETKCFQIAPFCAMTNQQCTDNFHCCSQICRTSASAQGLCR